LATVLIQALSSSFMFATVIRRGLLKVESWRDFIPRWRIVNEIVVQAIPASFNTMSVALSFFIVNFFLKSYGEEAIAAFGVTTRIEQIGLMPSFGLYAAILAMVGQNNGAKKYDRVIETIRFSNWVGMVLSLTTSLLILAFGRPLLGVFTDDPEVVEIGLNCIWIIMFVQWSYVITSTHLATLQALKKPYYGFYETVLRKLGLPLLIIVGLDATMDLGINSIWIGVAFAAAVEGWSGSG
jgi:Na+-driven multidrug efflux pump